MIYRVLNHALFNCIAGCYEGDALQALANSLGVVLPSPRGGRAAAYLESVSLLIDECARAGKFWDLFSAVYPLPVQRLKDVGVSLSGVFDIVVTLTPDLSFEPCRTVQRPGVAPKVWQGTGYRWWAYCCRSEWPPKEALDEILDGCILHVVILGNPDAGVNRGDGPEWVRTACTRYGDLPVAFCLPRGRRGDWERILANYGILLPASAFEYPTTVDEWKNTGQLDVWLLNHVESIQRHFIIKRPGEERTEDQPGEEPIFLLHISDLHLGANGDPDSDARSHYSHLVHDLRTELEVQTLDYLVVSGDIANAAKHEEYRAALCLVRALRKQFRGRRGRALRVILVPGNHDVDYEASKRSYATAQAQGRQAPSPDQNTGRFDNFDGDLYRRLLDKPYSASYTKQSLVRDFPDDGLLFACVNTAWEIDHQNENRASIHRDAAMRLQQAHPPPAERTDRLQILVGHHPINQIRDQGQLANLTAQGFAVCLHGHVHEAKQGLSRYDGTRSMHLVGAGTVGARPEDQCPGVPLQYNLIVLNKKVGTVLVETRRREKPNEPWWADARWGPDKNDPVPRYVFKV